MALLLAVAALRDIQTHRIPNSLVLGGLVVGLAGNLWLEGASGLLWSLAGIAAALPGLLLYAVRALGAGDVKLLMAVGALMGPVFLLWTLLGSLFAGGVLALIWVSRMGFSKRSVLPGAAAVSKASRMPFAPAVALGAAWAAVHLGLL